MSKQELEFKRRYEAGSQNRRMRSVMNSYIPENCQRARKLLELSSIQNPKSGEAISSEMASAIINQLSEELEKRLDSEEKRDSTFQEMETELKRLQMLLEK